LICATASIETAAVPSSVDAITLLLTFHAASLDGREG